MKATKRTAKKMVMTRGIQHPNFRNCTFEEAEEILSQRDRGEAIIRPSSKSPNQLSLIWKVYMCMCCLEARYVAEGVLSIYMFIHSSVFCLVSCVLFFLSRDKCNTRVLHNCFLNNRDSYVCVYLSLSVQVWDGVYASVPIMEHDRADGYQIGSRLTIGEDSYDDLVRSKHTKYTLYCLYLAFNPSNVFTAYIYIYRMRLSRGMYSLWRR